MLTSCNGCTKFNMSFSNIRIRIVESLQHRFSIEKCDARPTSVISATHKDSFCVVSQNFRFRRQSPLWMDECKRMGVSQYAYNKSSTDNHTIKTTKILRHLQNMDIELGGRDAAELIKRMRSGRSFWNAIHTLTVRRAHQRAPRCSSSSMPRALLRL
ncbi:uncharacterized protein LOC144091933 [Stigmatopora argus]